jgi:hypothetical protein
MERTEKVEEKKAAAALEVVSTTAPIKRLKIVLMEYFHRKTPLSGW